MGDVSALATPRLAPCRAASVAEVAEWTLEDVRRYLAVFTGDAALADDLALALPAWVALRARRRRVDARLLERPRPAAPPQP
jgi:hypothetical protein